MLSFLILTVAVTGLIFALSGLLGNRQGAAVGGRLVQLERPSTDAPADTRLFARIGRLVDPLVRSLSFAKGLDKQLYQVRWAWSPGEFVLASALLGLACGAIGLLFVRNPAIAVMVGLAGGFVPYLQLRQRRAATLKALNEQLPDALMLVINALKAGNSFLQALQLVANQMRDPIAGEFGLAVSEINWGMPVETALGNLRERIGSIDIDLVVQAMLIQRETGGNLSEILGNIHDTIRDRVRITGEVQALTAQGRLSGWILSGLPVGIGALFFLISPGYVMGLFTDPRGQMLVAGAVAAEVLGILAIRRIVDVRY